MVADLAESQGRLSLKHETDKKRDRSLIERWYWCFAEHWGSAAEGAADGASARVLVPELLLNLS